MHKNRLHHTRREFIQAATASVMAPLACSLDTFEGRGGSARLTARPRTPSLEASHGLTPLGLNPGGPDGFLLVPASYVAGTPIPLVLALHGAGIGATGPVNFLGPYAESHRFVLLVPASRQATWDGIGGSFGPDIVFINRALNHAFDRITVDPARIVIEGFSDGASYALSVGRANGDFLRRIVAFSPGFIPKSDSPDVSRPEVFVSHGRQDPILPIDSASRRIVPALEAEGYTVTYVEYDGVHSVTPAVAQQGVEWMLR
jgi:phospholipase/carboxylesterase